MILIDRFTSFNSTYTRKMYYPCTCDCPARRTKCHRAGA